MKQLFYIIAILLMPISATSLHAQENKHAQAMHTAFRETLAKKFPKNISSRWIPGNTDEDGIIYTALDGGGLVPKNKIHPVQLSKSRVDIGPNYLDGWSFEFHYVPDDPNLPLRQILDAYDKQSPNAASYYSYVADDEQAVFPGVSFTYGESGETFPLQLHSTMNVRIIGFKDDDGFRSTYLLMWKSEEDENAKDTKHKYYVTAGIMYEFHSPKLANKAQLTSYDPDEYLDRSNTALSVAQNLLFKMRDKDPEGAKALDTDTLAERLQYNFITMAQKLYDTPQAFNLKTSYEALQAKFWLVSDMSSRATLTEQKAICHTLKKELDSYPYQLSWRHASRLEDMARGIAKNMPDELKQQMEGILLTIDKMYNQTEENDSLSDNDQDYLNRNHWKLTHQPVEYTQEDMFTARGEYYTDDRQTGYIHVNSEDYSGGIRIENTLNNLRPGRYRVSAVVRADKTKSGHSGIVIFAQTGDKTMTKEIPADGDTGGNVWFSALNRFSRQANAHKGVLALDVNKSSVHGGQGYGWNRIYLDEITVPKEVGNDNLTYGVALDRDIVLKYGEGSNWFSACDFIVERVEE